MKLKSDMEREVEKLKLVAERCKTDPQSCQKIEFTTIRDSPDIENVLEWTREKGKLIKKRIDKDYGIFITLSREPQS